MKYAVETVSDAMAYLTLIQPLKCYWMGDTAARRQHGDLLSVFYFSKYGKYAKETVKRTREKELDT
jgi:hypothetical protein